MINKVESAVVTSRGRSELSGKYGGPGRGAEDTGGVGIGEINSSLGQSINIRSNCNRCSSMATNPVIHVVHSDEQYVGFSSRNVRSRNDQEDR